MEELKDRRYMERVRIPMAKLYYRVKDRHKLLNSYQGPFPISDISKSSLSIEGCLNLKNKTQICLKISIPDHPEILLKGQILGFISDRAGRVVKTIIQLMPYGLDPQYNSFKYKKRLEHCLSNSTPV